MFKQINKIQKSINWSNIGNIVKKYEISKYFFFEFELSKTLLYILLRL